MQSNKTVYYNLPYLRPSWPTIKQKLRILKQMKYVKFIDLKNIINSFQRTNFYFNSLQQYKIKWLKNVFSKIASFVLQVQQLYSHQDSQKFRLFLKQQTRRQMYSKTDIVLLMCFTALCLNKSSYLDKSKKRLFNNSVNFYSIYQKDHTEKLQFILNYFDHVLDEKNLENQKDQKFIICRFNNQQSIHENNLIDNNNFLLKNVRVMDKGSIEDQLQYQSIKIDFANEYIGGGALQTGCVQEQIMFLNHPELYVTMILCDSMGKNEAIGMHGFKKYFKNKGYAFSTKFDGFDNSMKYKQNQNGVLNDYIVAIDALCFPDNQYSTHQIMRQINKSYAGFKIFDDVENISTGNWGCGAFKGDPQLKFIIQWISATLVNKSITYYSFGEKKMQQLPKIIKILERVPVGNIMRLILNFQCCRQKINLFQYIFSQTDQKVR